MLSSARLSGQARLLCGAARRSACHGPNLPQTSTSNQGRRAALLPRASTAGGSGNGKSFSGGAALGSIRAGGGSGGGDSSWGGSSSGASGGGKLGLWTAYLKALESSPVLTKSLTSALLNLFGDVAAQKFVEKKENLDLKRMSIFTLLGGVLVGPVLHFWYLTISRVVTATGTAGTIGKLALDQLLFAPVFLSAFTAALKTLQGDAREIIPKLKQDLPSMVRANWTVWVPFQFLNFRFVPQHLQVLCSNVTALAWNIVFSVLSNKKVA